MLLRLITAAAALAIGAAAQDSALDHFEKRIRPVLAASCYPCHSSAPQGGLRLDSAEGIRKGGNSGPLIDAATPERSVLLRAIRHTDKALKMPPGKPLPPDVVAEFETWVRAGAPAAASAEPKAQAKRLWSLEPPRTNAARNDIDQFILSRLQSNGLSMAPEADKRTLVRRLYFDLHGLPPTAAEVDSFEADRSPDAFERLVDRLLSSPRYGERWARHWLDVARYADSFNDSVNAGQRYPWSYTYRDWVISALNEDLPYDKFALYQIAADGIPGTDPKHLAALGFLSLGREFPNSYAETVDDRIDAVTRGFLGLTVSCARCHDHKYDPIPTKDYYSLYSIFSNIRPPKELPVIAPASNKDSIYRKRLDIIDQADLEYRQRRHAEMVEFFRARAADYLLAAYDAEKLSNSEIEDLVRDRQLNLHMLRRWRKYLHEASADVTGSRPAIAEQLQRALRGPSSPVDVPLEEFESIHTEGDGNNLRTIKVRYNNMLALSAYDGATRRAMSVEDLPNPQPAHIFLRGNPNNPGALAPPRLLSCLGGTDDRLFKEGSGRLELARAIADPSNPLTARVIVNRVWMHHFGSGLVRTPSDFGFRGDPPSHPELLDHLAVRFMESGWSLKQLHRLILTSAAWKQSTTDNEAARKIDPENQLLWRANRRRLDIESVRDAALAAAGRLDLSTGGIPFPLTAQPSVPRRSVYGFVERGRVPGFLSNFDFASPDQHAPMRFVTTVPQQALFFLNSEFIAEQAHHLAQRSASARAPDERIRELYRYAFGRPPDQRELDAGRRFVSQDPEQDPEQDPHVPAERRFGGRPLGGAALQGRCCEDHVWRYGTGSFNATTERVDNFREFTTFTGDRWQGGPILPATGFGTASIRAANGEPGEAHPAVRRWISPLKASVSIEGTFRHGQSAVPYGDGVRGRIVSSRLGEIASWAVNGSSAQTQLSGVAVEPGDTIDFIVDGRNDPENDGFGWAPTIKSGDQTWSATAAFAGPPARPLDVWARYAQVLLGTNEFMFVD